MILVGKNIFPACFPKLSKPRYHQIRMRSTVEVLKDCEVCKLERDRSCNTFLLTLWNSSGYENEHQLNRSVISEIRDYLGHAKSEAAKGSVLITTGEGDSFCQGLDYRNAKGAAESGSDEAQKNRFLEKINLFKPVVADLISLPMPTIAALNGLSSVAGLLLSLSHDYLFMKAGMKSPVPDEWSANFSLPPFFEALIKSKALGSAFLQPNLVFRDLKLDDQTAAKIGFVDKDNEVKKEPVVEAKKRAKLLASRKRDGRVYAELRKALHAELWKELESDYVTPN